MQTASSKSGKVAAHIVAGVLYQVDETFSSTIKADAAEDALRDAVPDGPGGRDGSITSLKNLRYALEDAVDIIRDKIDRGPDIMGKIEKGGRDVFGIKLYARRIWNVLIRLEKTNTRLDFTAGELWLIPDLPTMSEVEDWRHSGVRVPVKLEGLFVVRVPGYRGDENGDARTVAAHDIPQHLAPVPAPPICEDVEDPSSDVEGGSSVKVEAKLGEPCDHVWESAAKLEAQGILESGEWSMSVVDGFELIGIRRTSFARLAAAAERGQVKPSAETPTAAEDVEGLWMVEYQGKVLPAEVAIAWDDGEEPVVLLPGIGTERPIDEVRLLWRIKVWTEAEVMARAGQIMIDHDVRPSSFLDFVRELTDLIGGVS
jgi:hypothetical protein